MLVNDRVKKLKRKKLCCQCIGETYLSGEVERQGQKLKCSYCGEIVKSFRLDELSGRIETAFRQHYIRTADQSAPWQYSLLRDSESDYKWVRDGESVVDAIMQAVDIPKAAAEDVQKILEDKFEDSDSTKMGDETEFSITSFYKEKGVSDEAWQEEWQQFEESLKTEARFFSRTAVQCLTSVFNALESLNVSGGRSLIVSAGPDTGFHSIYRARVFQSDDNLKIALCRPDQHIGPPPARLASAGRMNARGISVFYGANESTAAIAEVRPPVGSQVVVARFEIIRSLRLLDLTALCDISDDGSIFDPELVRRLERAVFLRSLSQRITRPVMPDDEAFEYLPTQAVADFLATETDALLDGIVFPSVQTAEEMLNVVLFHKAARVEEINVPKGTEISAKVQSDSDVGVDYWVQEEVPQQSSEGVDDHRDASDFPNFSALLMSPREPVDVDWREPTLRIVMDSVKVHVIKGVKFETEEFPVPRHRWEK